MFLTSIITLYIPKPLRAAKKTKALRGGVTARSALFAASSPIPLPQPDAARTHKYFDTRSLQTRSPPRVTMMTKPWDEFRSLITQLYIRDRLTLEAVRGIMKTKHNFEASIRSYRQHFDIWGVGKYNCKKRQLRRRSQAARALLPSPQGPPSLSSSSGSGSQTTTPSQSPVSEAQAGPYFSGTEMAWKDARAEGMLPVEQTRLPAKYLHSMDGYDAVDWRDFQLCSSAPQCYRPAYQDTVPRGMGETFASSFLPAGDYYRHQAVRSTRWLPRVVAAGQDESRRDGEGHLAGVQVCFDGIKSG
ncbi:hypothetical protein G7046_g7506 [Stylonectria norvegica]|nr:hypothetical protein G7046_g7506 [Stylonectria norvegica]